MPVSVMWFRLDLRLRDNPALCDAVSSGPDGVVPLLVLDDRFWGPGASVRQAYLSLLLREFDERIGGLHVVRGRPEEVVPRVAEEVGAQSVHISEDFTPLGSRRDADVQAALGDTPLVRTGSGYAVSPGRVRKGDGGRYQVFTPFYRGWLARGWRGPAPTPRGIEWLRPGPADPLPDAAAPEGVTLPPVGEEAALRHWRRWLDAHVERYDVERDLPARDTTSRMSVHLKWGTAHPRTLLADLAAAPQSAGVEAFRRELAFREFYAEALDQRPDSAAGYWNPAFEAMRYDEPGDDLTAWQQGRTGFPIVDAGMRQLLAQGWMHNRVRMIVASFLVKDLHLEWTHGARWFLDRLVDADLASNQHGWQWVAGCGTDAAPYFRIFNPVAQGRKFDPEGAYVRRWVPELADVDGGRVHEPWTLSAPPADYPPPLVDHAEERAEALRRYESIRR